MRRKCWDFNNLSVINLSTIDTSKVGWLVIKISIMMNKIDIFFYIATSTLNNNLVNPLFDGKRKQ